MTEKTVKISHSKLSDFNKCKRFYKYRYLDELIPKKTKSALQFGSIFHEAVEALYKGFSIETIQEKIKQTIESIDKSFFDQKDCDDLEWCAVVLKSAIQAWKKRFYDEDKKQNIEIVELEQKHSKIPVKNPLNGRRSKFRFSFISDMLVRINGNLWLVEYKTASQVGNSYINRLDIDSQISAYLVFLEEKYKESIEGVIYRILKKPSIRIRKNETKNAFYERLNALFGNETDNYLIEYRFSRTNEELRDFKLDLWEQANYLDQCEKKKMFPRNTSSCMQFGTCSYFYLCTKKINSELFYEKMKS
tara:strand:+ start:4783 stop:5694 length:912 start_codon:yes stop_codon:yes gene_type:complete